MSKWNVWCDQECGRLSKEFTREMMICVECGSKNKMNKNCLNHYLVEIDNLICNSILKLNKKGFSTFTCCSGHNTKKSFYGYVCFDKRPLKKFGKPMVGNLIIFYYHNEEQRQ